MAGRRQAAAAGWHGAARLGARQEGRKQQKPRKYRNRGDQVITVSEGGGGRAGSCQRLAAARKGAGWRRRRRRAASGSACWAAGVGGSERVSVSMAIGVSSPLGRRSRSSGWSSRSRRLHQTDSKQFYSATYTAAVRPWTPRRDT
eukprot:scaffold104838_cov60-Phaeocystis_antarctica.AAC.2